MFYVMLTGIFLILNWLLEITTGNKYAIIILCYKKGMKQLFRLASFPEWMSTYALY